MLYFKSLLVVIIACLMLTQPTVASQVTYYPGIPGVEPPWAVYILDFATFPPGQEMGFSETVGDLTVTLLTPLLTIPLRSELSIAGIFRPHLRHFHCFSARMVPRS